MNFGLFLNKDCKELIDMTTGEILAESEESIQTWLQMFEGNYTLTLI